MKITLIAALAKGTNAIGFENKLPWHLPADLKYFKEFTMGHTMLMGNNTFKSFPKMLPGRPHWVLSKNAQPSQTSELLRYFSSIEDAINAAKEANLAELFVIGGANVYAQAITFATNMVLTEVHIPEDASLQADAFFPSFNENEWEKTLELQRESDEKNAFATTVYRYKRK